MTQTSPLSELVRSVADHVEAKPDYEQRVAINVATGQAMTDIGFLDSFIGNFKYYLVTNSKNRHKSFSGRKSIKYKERTEQIVFAINYKGSCPAGYEVQLAQFFFRTSDPDKVISDALGNWLIEYFSTNSRTINQFNTEQAQAARDMSTKALNEFGLSLTITLSIENFKQPETIEIGPLLVSSRLLDSDEEEKLTVKAELEADPQNMLRALLNQQTSLTDLFKKGVKQYLATRVTLPTYYDDLNSDRVKQGLREHLNNLLKQYGRRVAFISLKPGSKDGQPPPPYKGETIIEYKHHESTNPIKLKISVMMMPRDTTRYRAKGSPELAPWVQANLKEVVDIVLFGVSYVDLLLDFRGPKQKIIEEMNRRAELIGYRIEQLMTMLAMEQLSWPKRIDLEIKGTANPSDDAMFETSVSGVYVGLEIFLTARVKDLRGVSRYLTTNMPAKMREEIIRLVGKTLHATDPQQFYKHYRESNKKHYPGSGPFETELRQKIGQLLESEFSSEVIHLVLKPTETDLTIKLFEVARTSHDFEATTEIGTTPGAPQISVRGSFTVEGVSSDGWEKFRERDVTSEKLRKRVENSASAFIKSFGNVAALASQEAVIELIKQALHASRNLIEDEFGLSINLKTISWDWDDKLKGIGRLRDEADLATLHERIFRQKDRLLDLYESNGSQEDIDATRASIARLSAMVPANLASSVGFRELPAPPSVRELTAAEVEL